MVSRQLTRLKRRYGGDMIENDYNNCSMMRIIGSFYNANTQNQKHCENCNRGA